MLVHKNIISAACNISNYNHTLKHIILKYNSNICIFGNIHASYYYNLLKCIKNRNETKYVYTVNLYKIVIEMINKSYMRRFAYRLNITCTKNYLKITTLKNNPSRPNSYRLTRRYCKCIQFTRGFEDINNDYITFPL